MSDNHIEDADMGGKEQDDDDMKYARTSGFAFV